MESGSAKSPSTRDILIAAAVLLVSLGSPLVDGRPLSTATVSVTVVACLPLLWRRRFPLTSVAVVGAVTLGSLAIGLTVPPWPAMVTVFSAACHLRRHRVLLAAAAVAWMLATAMLRVGTIVPSDLLTSAALAVLPVSLGYVWRSQADRAEALRLFVESEAGRARERERNRVAREVHDLVGHQLSAIRLRALGGRKAGTDSEETLGIVAGLAGDALEQVRALVDTLREDGAPGLSEVDELVAWMDGVLKVKLRRDLGDEDLPVPVQAAAYRIVQEALGNAARHASASRAEIVIAVRDGQLLVTVDDDGKRTGNPFEGNGIRGMRERAALLGGAVEAGPRKGRGWRVLAMLPLDGGRS
ncbi:sensor histidine kinase [Amycolatopsis azurea]|uniref:sensor histidine kinase n=1 Tax=Amycolatopsis azurea TaxID=36819 RepID=UPI0037F991F6